MELTDTEMHLLARLSRDRRLYAEYKGADLDALEKVGLLQWFDARSSTTPFKEDPRPLFRLLLFSGRIDYFWVAPVENWRELVGPEVCARVDAIDEIEWAVNNGLFPASRGGAQTQSDGAQESPFVGRPGCTTPDLRSQQPLNCRNGTISR
jgi:hypothetical protein